MVSTLINLIQKQLTTKLERKRQNPKGLALILILILFFTLSLMIQNRRKRRKKTLYKKNEEKEILKK